MRTQILLISADHGHLLERSLPAALAQPADVTVIDNASTDSTATVAAEHGATSLRLEDRCSWAAANNAAIASSSADAILLLNADCFLEPGFVEAAVRRLRDPGVASVAPRLVRTDGPEPADRLDAIDCAGTVVDRRRKNRLGGFGSPALAYDTPCEVFGPDGAAALYRRDALEDCRLGGRVLDEAMESWASDVDLAWRARRLGWRSVYEPEALAYHVRSYSPSTRSRMPEVQRRIQFRNRYLMMVKNDTAAAVRDLPWIIAWEAGALGWALARERHLLRAYGEAARRLPGALRARLELKRRLRGRPPSQIPFGLEAIR